MNFDPSPYGKYFKNSFINMIKLIVMNEGPISNNNFFLNSCLPWDAPDNLKKYFLINMKKCICMSKGPISEYM